MKNTKVAFFFGAGAEGKGNYEIVTGIDFLKASLYGEGIGDYRSALSNFFSGSYFDHKYKYIGCQLEPSNLMIKNIVIDRIRHAPTSIAGMSEDIAGILNKEDIKELKEEFEANSTSESSKLIGNIDTLKKRGKGKPTSTREKEFGKIIKENRQYISIKDSLLKTLFSENKENGTCYIDTQIGIGGFMDSYFHTIINPPKYSNVRFSKVFNYYWACYFVVLRNILMLFPQLYNEYSDGITIDCEKVLVNHHELTKKLYGESLPKKESYYEAIADYLNNKGKDVKLAGILTTNYFPFAEKVLEGKLEKGTAYLNGQLKWMEKPEVLEVFDLEVVEPGSELYFPFIFGQSMTKPIVHEKQIAAFHKANQILDQADYLIVLGYAINEDDNHINSLLHEYLMKDGKRIIIITNDINADYASRLRVAKGKIDLRVYDYCKIDSKTIVNEVMDSVHW